MTRFYFRTMSALAILAAMLTGGAVALGSALPGMGVIAYPYTGTADNLAGSTVSLLDVERGLSVTLTCCTSAVSSWLIWSPDGRYLVFALEGTRMFAVLEPRTGHTRRVGPVNSAPTWSPDAGRLAFASDEQGGLVILDRDSTTRSLILDYENTALPAWSPDGRRIAFIAYEQVDTLSRFNRVAFVYDIETGVTRELLPGHMHTAPIWSPDGRYLTLFPDLGQIRVIDADSGETVLELASDNRAYRSPVWAPDGESLAVVESRLGDPSLVRCFIDEGCTPPLTGEDVAPSSLAWSPDGRHIALLSNHETGYGLDYSLYLVSTDGSRNHDTLTRIITPPIPPQTSFAWQPR